MRWRVLRISRNRRTTLERRRFDDFQALSAAERSEALASQGGAAWIAAAARHGLVEAQVLLGQLYLDGSGVPADAVIGYRWFCAAASAGHPLGQNMAGRCLENGWGTPVDLPGATGRYREAAEAGLDWGQFNLANMLLYGLGTKLDRPAAYRWYEAAAAQGHAKSMNMLARFHEEGWDCARDRGQALRWYRRAAEGGDFRAQYNVGTLLAESGRPSEACGWFALALTQGSPDFITAAGSALLGSADLSLQALGRTALARHGEVHRPV